MKIFYSRKSAGLLAGLALIFISVCYLGACSKSDTPVDQIVEIMKGYEKKIDAIHSPEGVQDCMTLISSTEINEIIKENSDYPLTDSDKAKLKKNYDKLLEKAYDKTVEYVPSEILRKEAKRQLDLFKEGIGERVDKAETLGEIKDITSI